VNEDWAMNNIPAEATHYWFVVKAAVAPSPMLTFWAAGVIDWFLRRVLLERPKLAPQPGRERESQEPESSALSG
jgi:hypothetical protein